MLKNWKIGQTLFMILRLFSSISSFAEDEWAWGAATFLLFWAAAAAASLASFCSKSGDLAKGAAGAWGALTGVVGAGD